MKVVLFANTAWYLFNFRRSLALALQRAGHEVVLLSPKGEHGHRLRELGLRWEPAPMDRRSLNPFRELALVAWLRRFIVREQADLIHGFTIKCAVYGSLAAVLAGTTARVNAVAGMGYVFTSTDLQARLLRPLVRALMRIALDGRAARLILQNPDDAALFAEARLVHESRVRLIPGSGVDCTKFAPAERNSSDRPFTVVLAARLLWDKGLKEYVDAARTLKKVWGRSITLLLAGDPDPGNPASVQEKVVRGWESEGLITWLGHVEDMPALFRSVDAVILPSYREGLPKGLIEAAASGLPLVTTDVPGCREVVINELTGLLVPAKNAAALASAIARLQDDPELRERLARAARQKVLAEFDERIVIEKTVAVYKELYPAGSLRTDSADAVKQ